MSNKYDEALSRIQWVTNSAKFNVIQQIQIGDAIAAFDDCIQENKRLQELLNYIAQIEQVPTGVKLRIVEHLKAGEK